MSDSIEAAIQQAAASASATGRTTPIVIKEDRSIVVPTALQQVAVQCDNEANVLHFACPRNWADIDLAAAVLYINVVKPDKSIVAFTCTNVVASEDTVTFDWVITGHITEVAGKLSFLVCARDPSDPGDGYRWHSNLCNSLFVAPGIVCTVPNILPDPPHIPLYGTDTTLTEPGVPADAKVVGDKFSKLSEDIASMQISGLTATQVNALDGMFKVCAFIKDNVSAEYTAFKTAFGITDPGGGGGDPDEPVTPGVTLTSISATYSGGDVAVGTAVTELTGIVVTAHYSDGSSATVTGYTLDGTIAEGENTVTVIYGGKMTEFVVVGVAESGGEVIMLKNISFDGKSYLDTEVIPESVNYRYVLGIQAPSKTVVESAKNFGGVSARDHTSLDKSTYWELYWFATAKDNNYNHDVPSFEAVQACMSINAYLRSGNDTGSGTVSQPYDYPMYFSFDNGSQSLWLDENCTETPVKGAFAKVTDTVDFTNQTHFTDDEHPIISIWLGKVHVTGINSALAVEGNTYAGLKFYCFKVYDTDENLIADMKPAKQGDTIGMWDNIRNKFYPATANGGTVSYEEASA